MKLAFIPIALLAVPIVEIATFLVVGQWIGIGWTLAGILITAVLGTILLRRQGLDLMAQARREVDAGRVPAKELADGVMLLVAGILLLTPGFVTDAIGFSLFLPPVRAAIRSFVMARVQVVGPGSMGGMGRKPFDDPPPPHPDVVDLDADEYESRLADGKSADGNSPWKEPR
jgi:UPF0716 protein FxsA